MIQILISNLSVYTTFSHQAHWTRNLCLEVNVFYPLLKSLMYFTYVCKELILTTATCQGHNATIVQTDMLLENSFPFQRVKQKPTISCLLLVLFRLWSRMKDSRSLPTCYCIINETSGCPHDNGRRLFHKRRLLLSMFTCNCSPLMRGPSIVTNGSLSVATQAPRYSIPTQ
jgi:hypothetical protein